MKRSETDSASDRSVDLVTATGSALEWIHSFLASAGLPMADLGYDPVERTAASEAIRASTEFSERCPGTAVALRREW